PARPGLRRSSVVDIVLSSPRTRRRRRPPAGTAAVVSCSLAELRGLGLVALRDIPAALDVAQERLEVALEARAVVALEHPELVDLALEERALLLELGERAVVLVLRLADDPLRLRARVAEDAVALLL